MVSVAFTAPKSVILAVSGTVLFLFASFHPAFLGAAPMNSGFVNPNSGELIQAVIALLFPSVSLIFIRFLTDRYVHSQEVVKYLDSMGKKLVVFNHRLQELANTRGEEAVKQDRLRFTRDLHDGCGYAFTNIIAVTDAAVSRGQMETTQSQEIFQSIRNLATDGLRETRHILHLIREITEPYSTGSETILQLKNIFEEVTGIQVDIEWGNIRTDYGSEVNTVLARIVQEAFTNASRHGQATRIQIHFLEFSQTLSMVVSDNGVGAAIVVKGIGLAGMEERLAAMGGSLEVSQPPEGGFQLAIRIPLVA
jgi:signal transduction histidine kinase